MTIDVRGVNTHNKGAHLMMIAIATALSDESLSISPNGSAYDARARLGFRQTLVLNQAVRGTGRLGNLVPTSVRSMLGLTARKDITGVLDAAGFAYSDSFSAERAKREALLARSLDESGIPRIFLPQAFGPFTNETKASWCRQLLEPARCVYARDRQSAEHLQRLSPQIPVQRAPDFTVGLEPAGGPSPISGHYVAIVPNAKVVTHSGLSETAYLRHLVETARLATSRGLKVVVVVHEFSDRSLAGALSEEGSEVFEHPDPLVLKRVLADAEYVIASRFHAIVSGLSSGTPVVALGWSHKYEELMLDFGVPDLFVTEPDGLADRFRELLAGRLDVAGLATCTPVIKKQAEDMWADVRRVLKASTGSV